MSLLDKSHHVEQHHQHPSTRVHPFSPHGSPQYYSPSGHPFNPLPTRASPLGPPSTPPRRSSIVTTYKTPPLGRSTHLDRVCMAQEHEREQQAEEEEDGKLPASPSPMKKFSVAY